MRRGIPILGLALGLAIGTQPASAQDANTQPAKKPGTVPTFYGLLLLEQDPAKSDEEKLKEWQAFIARAEKQIRYAKKAVNRWKNAAKLRLVDAAKTADADPAVKAQEKIDRWSEVVRLYPQSSDGRRAQRRITYWTRAETKKLAEAAEEVERARRPKVERIKAWLAVLDWIEKGPEARAANKRINDLQKQLYAEAMSVDGISRVDKRTKLEAWKDVLAGRPSAVQKTKAEARVAKLESELNQEKTSMRIESGRPEN